MPIQRRSMTARFDWEHLCSTYSTLVSPTDVVLEIGASSPERTSQLAQKCASLVGVELFPDRIPTAFRNVTFVAGDWQRLTECVRPESIDIAISSHVIEHVPDDLGALNELYAVLRPGGVAILNTPNRKRPIRALIEALGKERQFPWWEHFREYTEHDLQVLLERSRFKQWQIEGVVLGIYGGPLFVYTKRVPDALKAFANFWEVFLRKEDQAHAPSRADFPAASYVPDSDQVY